MIDQKTIKNFFFLNRHCFVQIGKRGAAILDLFNKKVYSIDLIVGNVLIQCEQEKCPITKPLTNFTINESKQIKKELNKIAQLNLGSYYDRRIIIEKLRPVKPDYNKNENENLTQSIPLRKLWIEIEDDCNLNCVHCHEIDSRCSCMRPRISNNDKKINRKLNFRKWKNVLNDIVIWNPNEIHFIGGEPLLSKKKLISFIDYFKSIKDWDFDPKLIVQSNLILLNQNIISFFIKKNIQLKTTIYSDKEHVHNRITKTKGSWKNTINNLKKLVNLNIDVEVIIEIMKYNQDHVHDTINLIKDLGIENVNLKVLMTKKGKLLPNIFSNKIFISLDSISGVSSYEYFGNRQGNSCWNQQVAITSMGDVIPCIMARNFIIGNVFQSSLICLIRNKSYRKYWDCNKDKINGCKDCEFRHCCFDCRPREALEGYLYSKNKYCEIY